MEIEERERERVVYTGPGQLENSGRENTKSVYTLFYNIMKIFLNNFGLFNNTINTFLGYSCKKD